MKRLKLKRRMNKPRVCKPEGFIQRKAVIDRLRDLPVDQLSPIRQYVRFMFFHTYEDKSPRGDALSGITFATKDGTVLLTGNSVMFQGLYRELRNHFGPNVVPKKKEFAE